MFSSLARLRAFAFFAVTTFTPCIASSSGTLLTSSVTYCSTPETILIQQFDVQYFAANNSVSFNISAESVEANVNVSASILVNAFGDDLVNITVDLCSLLGGALCPLPEYNFTGADSLTVPSQYSTQLPDIAFKVPDLEAYVQLTLIEQGTNDVKACIQATVSNGMTAHQPAVEWTMGAIALLILVLALWQSLSPTAVLPYRLLDVIFLYQNIAISALLDLNYPLVYRAFALNFAWALSLFHSHSIQDSIDNMRARTGGHPSDNTSGSTVGFVDRQLSPYSYGETTSGSLFRRGATLLQSLQQRDVAVVTEDSSDVLQAGVPIYVEDININTDNAFMTVFLCMLVLIAITGTLFAAAWAVLMLMERFNIGDEERRTTLRHAYPSWVRAWIVRLCLIVFTPIVVFALYQWTIKDSWLSIFLAVITFLAIMSGVGFASFVVIRYARRFEPSALFTDPKLFDSFSPLYGRYLPSRYYFSVAMNIASFFRAVFISFGQWNGLAQVILLLLLEITVVAGVFMLRPHQSRGSDIFSSFLGIIRILSTGLMFAFVQSFNVRALVRYILGIVLMVIWSITILIVLANLVIHCGIHRLWQRRDRSRPISPHGSVNSMIEKGTSSPTDYSSSLSDRPRNPTPERNVPLDPEINRPYTPSTPTDTFTDYTSTRHRDSESTNLGSILPRRWSFTPLHTPTESALDHSPFESTLARTEEEA